MSHQHCSAMLCPGVRMCALLLETTDLTESPNILRSLLPLDPTQGGEKVARDYGVKDSYYLD